MSTLEQLRRTGTGLLAVMVVSGCSWNSRMQGPELPEMHQNLSRTVDLQTGIVQGDLGKVHGAANWILIQDHEAVFPASGADYREDLLRNASQIVEAETIENAAVHTGDLAATCGSCHAALGAGPKFVVGNEMPAGDSQEALMIRHLWAADRMWEGLVGPADEAWEAGAMAMAETRPALAEAFRGSTDPRRTDNLLGQVNTLAREAMAARTQADRGAVYGRLLTTCSQCHALAGVPFER